MATSIESQLEKLEDVYKSGFIVEQEYLKRKREILGQSEATVSSNFPHATEPTKNWGGNVTDDRELVGDVKELQFVCRQSNSIGCIVKSDKDKQGLYEIEVELKDGRVLFISAVPKDKKDQFLTTLLPKFRVREELDTVEEFLSSTKRLDVIECTVTQQGGEDAYNIEIKVGNGISSVQLKPNVPRKTKNEILEALPATVRVTLEVN